MTTTQPEDELQELLTRLRDDSGATRFNAALALAGRGHPGALPVLLDGLRHDSETVRLHYAVPALAQLGAVAEPALRAALESGDGTLLSGAARALWRLDGAHTAAVVPALVRALRDADPHARTDALKTLGEIGREAQDAVPAVTACLAETQETPEVRAQACATLAAIGEPVEVVASALRRTLRDRQALTTWWSGRQTIGQRAAQAIGTLGAAASDAAHDLVQLLHDPSETLARRTQAVYCLAQIGTPARLVVPALTALLSDPDWWLRTAAVRALAITGALDAVPGLCAAVDDPSFNVRRSAVYALAALGAPAEAALPALRRALEAEDIGGHAAEALARIGVAALPALAEALSHDDATVRRRAAYGLGKMTDLPQARELLRASEVEPWAVPPLGAELELPHHEFHAPKVQAFETLYAEALDRGPGATIEYRLPAPKYQFLCYLAERKGLLLHGSNVIGIDLLNPVRRSTDRNSWGNVSGIYADPDGVRPIYFATVDRTKVRGLSNGVRRRTVDGVEQVRYFFSIDAEALREDPWTDGMVYVLPREPFEHTERQEWTCRQPLRPLARIPVSPADFPFRAQTLGFECWHFDQRLREAFAGFPYLQDVREFAIRPETLSTRRH